MGGTVNWDIADFLVFGALLAGVAGCFWLVVRRTDNIAYRTGVGIALAGAFILIWVSGAVGIIGDPENDANLMYVGVLAIGIIGAFAARFEARGMMLALFATACAQVLAAVIALVAGLGSSGPAWPWDILVITGFLTVLWLASALLFRKRYLHP